MCRFVVSIIIVIISIIIFTIIITIIIIIIITIIIVVITIIKVLSSSKHNIFFRHHVESESTEIRIMQKIGKESGNLPKE